MAEITPIEGFARLILRGEGAARAATGTGFGVPMPDQACRAETVPPRAALWLGPDEFLLLLPEADLAAIQAALAAALAPYPHALVDVTHRQIALRIAGPGAANLLNAGCPLDLDLAAFPVGCCARTMLAKVEIVLWRTGAWTFHMEVARSCLAYVSTFLDSASRMA